MFFYIPQNFGDEHFRVLGAFLVAHAADAPEILFAERAIARHLAQGDIRKNNVGGHLAFVGQALAQGPQARK